MNYSGHWCFDTIIPYLNHKIISQESISRISSFLQYFPFFSYAGFETSLGIDTKIVDFQVNYTRQNLSPLSKMNEGRAWRSLQSFNDDWINPNTYFEKIVSSIWLEFDLNSSFETIPEPCIFFMLNKNYFLSRDDLMQFCDLSVFRFINHLNPFILQHIRSNLVLCLNSLPVGAYISSLGVMLSRSSHSVRVNIKGLGIKQIPCFLNIIGFKGNTDNLSLCISKMLGFYENVVLAFDLNNNVFSKIGLECYFAGKLVDEKCWKAPLSLLTEIGLCMPSKFQPLIEWPGYSTVPIEQDFFAQKSSLNNYFVSPISRCYLWRAINHIKLNYQNDSFVEAKGYLSFGYN